MSNVTLPYSKLTTLEQAKEQNKRAGFHFFSKDTLAFFSSRISSDARAVDGGLLFVTSEQFVPFNGPAEPRKYTLRFIRNDGSVGQLKGTEFQEYATLHDAKRAMNIRAAVWNGAEAELEY